MQKVFKTDSHVVIYPPSGTGAWESALVNTLSAGDLVLMAETGHFATLWKKMATELGLRVEFLPGDWRRGVDPLAIEARLKSDPNNEIKAVCIVHNETATGALDLVAALAALPPATGELQATALAIAAADRSEEHTSELQS